MKKVMLLLPLCLVLAGCDQSVQTKRVELAVDYVPTNQVPQSNLDKAAQKNLILTADAVDAKMNQLAAIKLSHTQPLKTQGLSALQLKKANFKISQLKAAGFTAKELAQANYSAEQLREAHFSAAELKAANFNAAELKAAHFKPQELANAGFSVNQLVDASIDPKTAQALINTAAKNPCSVASLEKIKSSASLQPLIKKCKPSDFNQANINPGILFRDGIAIEKIVAGHYSATQLIQAGFSTAQLKPYFKVEQLLSAKYRADQPQRTSLPDAPNLDTRMTLVWNGPMLSVIKKIAMAAKYNIQLKGRAPATPILVTLDMHNEPLIDILRNIQYQVVNNAQMSFTINSNTQTINIDFINT
jgi:uncharacterized protein YjbI with pentapeptide repeats